MILKSLFWTALMAALPATLLADLSIQIAVDPGSGRTPISPYVYGTNQDLPNSGTPGVRRFGGDRLTGYDWETNASNAGTDYLNNSDNYLVSGLPSSQQATPAIALTSFHDQSLQMGTPYTILTLQMAGYVAADEAGPVTAAQAAPSPRWNAVQNNTPGGVFPATPNLADGTVYMDELLNLLISRYGPATGSTGVRGYNLDNEPSLWPSTHPYLHPAQTTCAELVTKSVALAKTVKRMDPTADVLGGVLYGSGAYFTFQSAPDWPSIENATGYRWFIDYFLSQMSAASASAGTRLLDVLDLHRYSDENISGTGPDQSITSQTDFSDTATNMDRVQAPRVLWDKTYIENSWVQQYDSQFLPWIPNLQASITARYPGTKLSFSEYSYGGESDISGGIAQADVLGIFGKFGVYLGCVWILHDTPAPLYTARAFQIYLNYDGQGGRFGDTAVAETDSDTVNTSAYASTDSSGALHIVAINKSYTQAVDLSFQIAGATAYTGAKVYAFNGDGTGINELAPGAVTNNTMTYALPPLTVAHFIFGAAPSLPQITAQPTQQFTSVGGSATFTVAAKGASLSYQWSFNGAPIAGAASASYTISNAQTANAGNYTVTVTNSIGSTTSSSTALTVISGATTARLVNISTRAVVGTGVNILIPGFVIGGSGNETLLIRADGPSLAGFGVSGTIAQPVLAVFDSKGNTVASNTGWGTSSNPAQLASVASLVGAFAFAPGSADSAVLVTLPAGAYTAQVSGVNNGTGVALAEVYEVAYTGTRLANISTRASVGTGGNIAIAGFVIQGSGTDPLLIRADGPALAQFGVGGVLAQPILTLIQGASATVASNTGWANSAAIAAATTLAQTFQFPAGSADSALVENLTAGSYTAQVSGVNSTTGVALAEVYEVP